MKNKIKLLDKWLCDQTDKCLAAIPEHGDGRYYTKEDKINNYRALAFIETRLELRKILNEKISKGERSEAG